MMRCDISEPHVVILAGNSCPRVAQTTRRVAGWWIFQLVLLALALAAPRAGAQTVILDRVVAVVGGVPVTASDVAHECALEEFLAGAAPSDPSTATRSAALSRLIDQKLLESELENYHFDRKAEATRAQHRLENIKRRFHGDAKYTAAMRALGLDKGELLGRLVQQDEILEMINRRLRPAAAVEPKEVEQYYRRVFLPEFAKERHGTPPSLAATEPQIREILTQKKINSLLEQWLKELRAEDGVRILKYTGEE